MCICDTKRMFLIIHAGLLFEDNCRIGLRPVLLPGTFAGIGHHSPWFLPQMEHLLQQHSVVESHADGYNAITITLHQYIVNSFTLPSNSVISHPSSTSDNKMSCAYLRITNWEIKHHLFGEFTGKCLLPTQWLLSYNRSIVTYKVYRNERDIVVVMC